MDIRLEKLELMKLLLQTESESVLKKVSKKKKKNEEHGYISQNNMILWQKEEQNI